MCNPVAIAGLMAASNAAQYIQGTALARATEQRQKELYRLNTTAAQQNAFNAYVALGERQRQEHEAAARSIDEAARMAAKARGTATVAAGESGVAGGSFEALLNDFSRQALEAQSVSIRNRAYMDAQLAREREGVRAQQYAQTLSGLPQGVQYPSLLSTLLTTGAQVGGLLYGTRGPAEAPPPGTPQQSVLGFNFP